MKKLLPFFLIAFVACTAPKKQSYTLSGKIEGTTPEKVYLYILEEGKFSAVDSTEISAGAFTFTGKLDYPDYYYIQFGTLEDYITLFLENSEIKITGSIDSLSKATITGSTTQDAYDAYLESKKVFDDQMSTTYQNYKAATDETVKKTLMAALDSLDLVSTEASKQYIKNNPTSVLSAYIIQREIIYYLELAELEELTNGLSPELANYRYIVSLKKRIELLKSLQPGMVAPDFTQNDKDGNPVKLSDLKGQVVLVDFWASWCGPCRRANPTIVEIFKKYNSKGFTVLGVSMDKDRQKWLEAIEADGLTWNHVSTLEGWANPVGKLYGVNSIPHAVLVNRDGTIIKRGVQPEELDSLLGELLK